MSSILQPWHIMLAALCGLVNQRQRQIIEFQNAQIEALLKKLGKKRLLLNDGLPARLRLAPRQRELAVKTPPGVAFATDCRPELTSLSAAAA